MLLPLTPVKATNQHIIGTLPEMFEANIEHVSGDAATVVNAIFAPDLQLAQRADNRVGKRCYAIQATQNLTSPSENQTSANARDISPTSLHTTPHPITRCIQRSFHGRPPRDHNN